MTAPGNTAILDSTADRLTITPARRDDTLKTITRVLAAAVVAVGAALGWAGPAAADEVLQGVYNYHQDGVGAATWTIFPSCVPTVGDLREPLNLPVACRLHVNASRPLNGGDARLVGGLWEFDTAVSDGVKCPDGSTAPLSETYQFDGNTLTGTRTVLHNPVCGLPAEMTKFPFTLSFKDQLPIPVDRYPLVCEPAGLRICS